jgi:signal peptidase
MMPDNVKNGDAITFRIDNLESVVATHRVVEINNEMRTFTTKGDANQVVDSEPVSFENFIGRADIKIPFLGFIAMYIQTKEGIVASVGIFLFVAFLSLLDDVLKKEKKTVVIEEQKPVETNEIL